MENKQETQMPYSQELEDVMAYMLKVIVVDFNLKTCTPHALLLSMIEESDCNAATIMQKYAMSTDIMRLTKNLAQTIDLTNNGYHDNGAQFDDELVSVLGQAEIEARRLKSPEIGTQHVLLALLHEGVCFPCGEELRKYINYDMVLSTYNNLPNKSKMSKKLPKRNLTNLPIQLKSTINPEIIYFESSTEYLDKYTTNINEMVRDGKCENLVNRPKLMSKIIQVLSRRKKNNVVLVGNGGVGSTSLVHLLASLINNDEVPSVLKGKTIYMLDSVALVSGTSLKGMFEERVNGLFKELTASENNILFIDNMQTVVRNTGRDKDGDLTDILGPILTDGKVRVIGTMSFKDYRNGVENAPVLSHKLQKIVVESTTDEETFEILKKNRSLYEKYHHVLFSDDCLRRIIKLSKRYITNNNLPDSAIDVMDITGARMSRGEDTALTKSKKDLKNINKRKANAVQHGQFEKLDILSKKESKILKTIDELNRRFENDNSSWYSVNEEDIDDTVASMTDIPIAKLKASDRKSILNIGNILKQDVIGQDEAIEEIAKAIKRNRAGFNDKNKVYATFMLISQTGCGKTLLAKKLAENIFGSEKMLVRFDMSEYQDKTAINKLIGSSAGYVGYENGGLLTEAIKNKPHCVLLFDEIEKADESIYNLFLQLFDEGRLTDNNGTLVNFKNVIVIMTSNVGAKQVAELGKNIGFNDNSAQKQKSIFDTSLKSKFNPEFLNRIDKIIYLNPLDDSNLKAISKIELDKIVERVKEEHVNIQYDESVVDFIYKKAVEQKEYGARPIMRIIQDNISDKLSDYVLCSESKDVTFDVTIQNEEVRVSVK